MDYKYEFERLFNVIDQYIKSNGESKAAKQALLNAHKFYTDSGFVSSNSDYVKCGDCGEKLTIVEQSMCINRDCVSYALQ